MSAVEQFAYLNAVECAKKGWTEAQSKRYYSLCDSVNKGKMTMNQAYNEARKPFSNFAGDSEEPYNGGFALWIKNAQEQGWIDRGVDLIRDVLEGRSQTPDQTPPPPLEPEKASGKGLKVVAITVSVVVVIGLIYYVTKAENK